MRHQFYIPSNLQVITLPSSSPVAYCGIAVHAGTRNEKADQQGLAHFCEHLTFKGTNRRNAMRIINDIEGLGGELNAFTNKEDTVFYCAIQREHLRKAIDVLVDIVFNSIYPQAEVEKECEVVCDEIDSYEDTPAELIYDEFENLLFDGHPLGHNILGTSEQVRTYTSADAARFTQQWYRPENCVLFVTGTVPPSLLPATASQTPWHSLQPEKTTPGFKDVSGQLFVRNRQTHQAHVMLGTRAFAADDDRRWVLYLLNNILGGPCMNSRLNLSLRERHALVYTVESSMVSYSDVGLWSVYFGCDADDVKHCLQLVRRELDKLMVRPLSMGQLHAAKQQLRGQLAIASDNREQMVLDYARSFLHTGKGRTVNDVMAHIDAIKADDLQKVACQLFAPERLTTLLYK
ncbi:MAG: insulinase family protein [Prevotella sp.]|nr:insulinase family protein [Prevotella sp.]